MNLVSSLIKKFGRERSEDPVQEKKGWIKRLLSKNHVETKVASLTRSRSELIRMSQDFLGALEQGHSKSLGEKSESLSRSPSVTALNELSDCVIARLSGSLHEEGGGLVSILRKFNRIKHSQVQEGPLNYEALWQELKSKGAETRYMHSSEISNHAFKKNACPLDTIIGDYFFLHANKVGEKISSKKFVVAQAPRLQIEVLKNGEKTIQTISARALFWDQIFESEGSNRILDLSHEEDQGVLPYCPKDHFRLKNGPMVTRLDSSDDEVEAYSVKQGGREKIITRYRPNCWRDGETIDNEKLDELVRYLKESEEQQVDWIHSRAGVGRPGTLLAAFYLEEKIAKGEITEANLEKEIIKIVLKLREQRGVGCVANQAQLQSIFEYGFYLLKKTD